MERLIDFLRQAVQMDGSDVFIIPGSPVEMKRNGQLTPLSEEKLTPAAAEELIGAAYELAGRRTDALEENGDDDFSFAIKDLSRFRCNAYRQRGTLAAICRIVAFGLPDPVKMQIPENVMRLADERSGMILITGPAGSGKSTTLACLIDRINRTRPGHIITIEDPIEFLHPHQKSLVSQREVPNDAPTFARALRAAMRQAPDVLMLGEMRDAETIRTAITAAETGHLVLSSMHTIGAARTIDRIVDAFPAEQQQQIRLQLSMALCAVVSQRLVPGENNRSVPVFEEMRVTTAIRTLIRDGYTYRLDNAISAAAGGEMNTMDAELVRLAERGKIDAETAQRYAEFPENVKKRLFKR